MALMEVLALQLGSAIAKSILKLWLKDSSLAQDIGSEILDIVKAKTSDLLAQRRAQRQFEEIGEKVAESLLPVFENESSSLDEGGQTAVALAVAQTLNQARINPALLVERNLEPSKLAQHLLNADPSMRRDFSPAEMSLYQGIISESSMLIVDIVSQLPTFTERTFAEVLKRENILLAQTEQIIEEVRRIRESSQQNNPKAEAARFEAEYRRAVVRKLDELELFGVDVSAASRRHRLSVAYVALSVAQPSLIMVEDKPNVLATPRQASMELEGARYIVPADVALAGANRLIIRGQAGSGKTTLLQWIAVRSASQSFVEPLSKWNDTIPFLIRLRQHAQYALPAPEEFPHLVAPSIAGTMPAAWVHDKLRSGQAIVLIDGVDEVAQSVREQVHQWLKEVIKAYPNARYIVSSRPHAIDEGWLEHEGFDEVELQPMEPQDINTFIDHWHAAVREELRNEEDKAELGLQAERMKKAVQRMRAIRNLATSPLLCAMLCTLNRARRQQLPSDRIELYRAGCEMLLDRRDKERDVDLRDYPAIGYRQKVLLLQDLAYWLIVNSWSMVALERAEERIERRLSNLQGIPQGTTSADVLRLFVERSGLVRSPEVGRMDFTHRTFQEYLAAQEALDEGDTGLLVRNAHDDQWREVIVLAAGLANKRRREEIIHRLIERGDNEPTRRYQLHLLAVACLETSVEHGQELIAQVQQRLAKIVPPKNMADAKALAAAGELAVPYLARQTHYSASVAAACVRALSLIGGETALAVLEDYLDDRRSSVIAELWRARESFDRKEYTRQILVRLVEENPQIQFDNVVTVAGLENVEVQTIWLDYTRMCSRSTKGKLGAYGFKTARNIASLIAHSIQCNFTKVQEREPSIPTFLINTDTLFGGISSLQELPILVWCEPIPESASNQAWEKIKLSLPPNHHSAFLILPIENRNASQFVKGLQEKADANAIDLIVVGKRDFESITIRHFSKNEFFKQIIFDQISIKRVSPYQTESAVVGEQFFGREREIREICYGITSKSFSLIGARRIGKTSILHRLHQELQDHLVLYCNGQGADKYDGEKNYHMVLGRLNEDYRKISGRKIEVQGLIDFANTLSDQRPLILLLDEADGLLAGDRVHNWKLFSELRVLSQSRRCQCVLAGEVALRQMQIDANTPFYNFAHEVIVGCFDRSVVSEMVTRPMEQIGIKLVDSEETISAIMTFSGGHPNIVQRLCSRLVTRLDQSSRRELTLSDTMAVINEPTFQRHDFLETYFQRTSTLERLVMLIMAQAQKPQTRSAIRRRLATYGISTSIKQLEEALQLLVTLRGVLDYSQDGYRCTIDGFTKVLAGSILSRDMLEELIESYQEYRSKVAT